MIFSIISSFELISFESTYLLNFFFFHRQKRVLHVDCDCGISREQIGTYIPHIHDINKVHLFLMQELHCFKTMQCSTSLRALGEFWIFQFSHLQILILKSGNRRMIGKRCII